MRGLAHDTSGVMWDELDDRRPFDEEPLPEPEAGWRTRRPVWPGTGLHANPAEFPPEEESDNG